MRLTDIVARAKAAPPDTAPKPTPIKDRLHNLLDEFEGIRALVEQSGIEVIRLSLTLSLPPDFTIFLRPSGSAPSDFLISDIDHLSPYQQKILNAIKKANQTATETLPAGYALAGYELTLSLPPAIRIHFVPSSNPVGQTLSPGLHLS